MTREATPRLSAFTAQRSQGKLGYRSHDRHASRGGIVHLGIGAFHRAHQAVYTDDAVAAGDANWGITGVSLRSPAVRAALSPQDYLYTVVERSAAGREIRLIDTVNAVLVASQQRQEVLAALASPQTHIVSLTVTEKGYCRSPADGRLDFAQADQPDTIYDFLAKGLGRRRDQGGEGLTLISCDNLPDNGHLLANLLKEYCDRHFPDLAPWLEQSVACPNTVVDRIVPATTVSDIAELAQMIGVEDRAMINTEPFRQWIIEDRFAGPRPRWEAGGAQIVKDVRLFELVKLRMLNGSHSTLAYLGLGLGFDYVHEAIADPALARLIGMQMTDEVIPCLPVNADIDPYAYRDALLGRFRNAALDHKLSQIAMDGSQKIAQRWLGTIFERQTAGLDSPIHLIGLAAWIVHTRGGTSSAGCQIVDDPLAPQFASLWEASADDIDRLITLFTRESGVFPPEFARNKAFCEGLVDAVRGLLAHGHRAQLETLVAGLASR